MTVVKILKRIKRTKYWQYKRFFIFLSFRKHSIPTEASTLINLLSQQNNLQNKYLEIGVESGRTFQDVKIREKTAVDPYFHFNTFFQRLNHRFYRTDSDSFFERNSKASKKFDIIFLDGLHTFEQTYRDLQNSMRFLSWDSLVIIDDTVPNDECSSLPNQNECFAMRKVKGVDHDLRWHGDVYKVICALHLLEIPHLEWATLVDLENPKTVLWMTKAEKKEWPQLPSIPSHTLDHYNYESCFKPSLNLLFHPMTQSQALKKILARKS